MYYVIVLVELYEAGFNGKKVKWNIMKIVYKFFKFCAQWVKLSNGNERNLHGNIIVSNSYSDFFVIC